MRLVAFGCSNTFGQSLPDVWDYEKNEGIFNQGPSKYAWPQLLADKLNVECINNGIPGASNKEIWYNIVNAEFENDDIIIILWSHLNRYCLIQKNKIMQLGTWMVMDQLRRWCFSQKQREQTKTFFKYFYNEYDMLLDFYLRTNHIQSFLQDKVELVKHLTIFKLAGGQEYPRGEEEWGEGTFHVPSQPNFNPLEGPNSGWIHFDQLINWNKIKLSHNLCMDDFIEQYPSNALDSRHPGLKTHKEFATAIYNEIKYENPEKFNRQQ